MLTKLQTLTDKLCETYGYVENYETHDVYHVITGAVPGLSHEKAQTIVPVKEWRNLFFPGHPTLRNNDSRQGLNNTLDKTPRDKFLSRNTRNEAVVGFLQNDPLAQLVFKKKERYAYEHAGKGVHLNTEAEIPFFTDEYMVRTNQAYLSYMMFSSLTDQVGLLTNDGVFRDFTSSKQLDAAFQKVMPHRYENENILFCFSKDAYSPDQFKSGISYSDEQMRIGTADPLIYSLKGYEHILYGKNVTIVKTAPMDKIESFECCMSDYFKKTATDFYENDPNAYLNHLTTLKPIKVESPYKADTAYETSIGANRTVVFPENRVIDEFSISSKEFVAIVNDGYLRDTIEDNLKIKLKRVQPVS